MWDRCHWRFLYYINNNVTSLVNHIHEVREDYADVIAKFDAMNEEGNIYKFATKCGSWDWKGICIMLVCCNFFVFLLIE